MFNSSNKNVQFSVRSYEKVRKKTSFSVKKCPLMISTAPNYFPKLTLSQNQMRSRIPYHGLQLRISRYFLQKITSIFCVHDDQWGHQLLRDKSLGEGHSEKGSDERRRLKYDYYPGKHHLRCRAQWLCLLQCCQLR